jgi:CheY-like chemotaxis protein
LLLGVPMSQVSAVDLFRQAMIASRSGDKEQTQKLLREATKLDPNSETTWQWLASVLEKPLEATAAWERVLALNPNNEKAKAAIRPVRLQAGIEAAKSKDIATARRLLRVVVADEPKNEHGWLWLASVCDSPAEAKAHLERVLSINPASVAAKKGIAYYNNKLEKAAPPQAPTVVHEQAMKTTVVMRGAAPTVASRANDTPSQAAKALSDLLDSQEPRKALIIDGSRTYRKLVSMIVVTDGFTSLEAEDAAEAIDRIRDDGVPSIVLVDSKLTGIDAFELCNLLRQHPDTENVPVILLHSVDAPLDKNRVRNCGITSVASKPLQPEKLLESIRVACRANLAHA